MVYYVAPGIIFVVNSISVKFGVKYRTRSGDSIVL